MRLHYTLDAIENLRAIHAYIKEVLCNEDAANRTISRIFEACDLLEIMPLMGPALKHKIPINRKFRDYRYLVIGNYLAFYQVDGDTVSICRILDGRTAYWREFL